MRKIILEIFTTDEDIEGHLLALAKYYGWSERVISTDEHGKQLRDEEGKFIFVDNEIAPEVVIKEHLANILKNNLFAAYEGKLDRQFSEQRDLEAEALRMQVDSSLSQLRSIIKTENGDM